MMKAALVTENVIWIIVGLVTIFLLARIHQSIELIRAKDELRSKQLWQKEVVLEITLHAPSANAGATMTAFPRMTAVATQGTHRIKLHPALIAITSQTARLKLNLNDNDSSIFSTSESSQLKIAFHPSKFATLGRCPVNIASQAPKTESSEANLESLTVKDGNGHHAHLVDVWRRYLRACATTMVLPGFAHQHDSLFLGVVTNCTFLERSSPHQRQDGSNEAMCNHAEAQMHQPRFPAVRDHNMRKWLAILEAIVDAGLIAINRGSSAPFVYVEIGGGAGWGKWAVDAYYLALLSGRFAPNEVQLVVVEPNQEHCAFARQHMITNAIPFDEASNGFQVICRAISDKDDASVELADQTTKLNHAAGNQISETEARLELMKTVKISTMLESTIDQAQIVNVLDVHIQGREVRILTQAFADVPCLICNRVRLVTVGTESSEAHAQVKALFLRHGWKQMFDVVHDASMSPKGPAGFEKAEGMLAFQNPLLIKPSQFKKVSRFHDFRPGV